jgi:hypothetical protein
MASPHPRLGNLSEMIQRLCAVLASGLLLGAAVPVAPAPRTYYCFGKAATIVGTPGDDEPHGGDGSDVIVARGCEHRGPAAHPRV